MLPFHVMIDSSDAGVTQRSVNTIRCRAWQTGAIYSRQGIGRGVVFSGPVRNLSCTASVPIANGKFSRSLSYRDSCRTCPQQIPDRWCLKRRPVRKWTPFLHGCYSSCRFFFDTGQVQPGMDLRIGHGLGPRAFGGPAQRSFLWRPNVN